MITFCIITEHKNCKLQGKKLALSLVVRAEDSRPGGQEFESRRILDVFRQC